MAAEDYFDQYEDIDYERIAEEKLANVRKPRTPTKGKYERTTRKAS